MQKEIDQNVNQKCDKCLHFTARPLTLLPLSHWNTGATSWACAGYDPVTVTWVRLRECMLMRNRFGRLEAVSHPQHVLGIAGNGTRCGASSYVEQMEASYTIQYHT